MVECEFNLPPFQNLPDRVLIDTWWNVNLTSTGYVRRDVRFNRYMVECECINFIYAYAMRMGFNRYMVECELRIMKRLLAIEIRF